LSENILYYKELGLVDYQPTWQAMQQFTLERSAAVPDQIWFLEHPPVFTQGQNGKAEHLLAPGDIPVIQVDRGGQITYHGPGQMVVYLLIDLKRRKIGIRTLVCAIEQSVIDFLAENGIHAKARRDAPGVYLDNTKIASLGLRVKRGCSYHGLAFNIDMDLAPFKRINPCGLSNITMTQVRDLGGPTDFKEVQKRLLHYLTKHLAYDEAMLIK
jgi:lipoyl(octanoyl) transferase